MRHIQKLIVALMLMAIISFKLQAQTVIGSGATLCVGRNYSFAFGPSACPNVTYNFSVQPSYKLQTGTSIIVRWDFAVGSLTISATYSGCGSGTTTPTVHSVNVITNPSISITASQSGSTATFTATAQNTYGGPIYQWKLNDGDVGSNSPTYSSTTLQNNDRVYAILIPPSSCSPTKTSNTITMSISPPPAPIASAATGIEYNVFYINWLPVSTAMGYFLDISTDINFSTYVSGYENVSTSGTPGMGGNPNGPVIVYGNFLANTIYHYRLRAVNGVGQSASSNVITVLTAPSPPIATAPTNITATTFTANWNGVPGAISYHVEVSENVLFSSIHRQFSSVTGTSVEISGLSYGTNYFYRVRAKNGNGTSSANSNTIVTGGPLIALPADYIFDNSFNAHWEPSGATQYVIDVSTNSEFSSFVPGYNGTATDQYFGHFQINNLSPGTTYYYRFRYVLSPGIQSVNSNVISLITNPSPPTATAATNNTTSSFMANWNSVPGASEYRLSVSTNNFSTIIVGYNNLPVAGTSATVTGLTIGGTYQYRVRAFNIFGSSTSSNIITTGTLPAAPIATLATDITPSQFFVNWQPANGATGYVFDVCTDSDFSNLSNCLYKDVSTSGGSGFTGNPFGSIVLYANISTRNNTYYYRIRAVNSFGQSSNSNTITVEKFPPIPTATEATNVTKTSFTANWINEPGALDYLLEMSISSTFSSLYSTLPVSGITITINDLSPGVVLYYRVRARNTSGTSNGSNIIIAETLADHNYIISSDVMKGGISTEIQLTNAPIGDKIVKYDYFDGTGRLAQSVSQQASPSSMKRDVVQPVVYDGFGRETIKYLPYVSESTDASYQHTAIIDQQDFYSNGSTDKIEDDPSPFAETRVEPSPLKRVLKQGTFGDSWQPDAINAYTSTDKTIKKAYETNGPNEVLHWSYAVPTNAYPLGLVNSTTAVLPTTPIYYHQNQLSKNRTKDEEGMEVLEYIDKTGRIVLKRVQAVSGSPVVNDLTFASTYYIYDIFGNLVTVIPPEATKRLATEYYHGSATDASKESFLSRWAFRYRYDSRKRIKIKKVPGADSTTFVYDNRDRIVMTQDGNQRTNSEWTFTKYDALNRPVLTGKYLSNSDRGVVQNDVKNYYAEPLATGRAGFETYVGVAGTMLGYDNKSFPTAPLEANYLTATYYDRYDSYIAPLGYTYLSESLVDSETSIQQETKTVIDAVRVKGQVTATCVKNLSTSQWMRTVHYYDAKYRLVQSISDHQKGTFKVSNIIDFTGKVLLTKKTYVVNGVTIDIEENPDYDHVGRLKWIKHQAKKGTEVIGDVVLLKNEYNELGQLVDKKLHSTNTDGTDAKQSIDYRYNIRGWLTRINDSNLTIEESDPKDYFGMNLAYNTDFESGNFAITKKNYNGNISAIKWNVGLGEGSVKEQAYDFSYDAMNRLSSATHMQSSAPNTWATGHYDENVSEYDLNGNIRNLQRKGEGGATIDNLVYNYGLGAMASNKLLFVKDNALNVKGFNDANPGDVQDYTYDDNGNLTRDLNKGIGTSISDANSKITYNYLNLPETVTKGENTIRYVYDATGRKLAQTTTFGAITKEVDYIGELQLENNALQFINHAEGRIVMEETKLIYFHNGETQEGIASNGADISLLNGEEKYVQATSNSNVSRTGISSIGGTFIVASGERYKIRVKGYRTGNSFAYLLIKGNGADLNWPGAKLPLGVASESWVEQIVTIPAATTTLQVGLVWDVLTTTGQVMFLNEFEITKLGDNITPVVPEYQYHLKDHLGNVRVTFTTKSESDQSLATLEMLRASQEHSQFIYYDEAVKVNAKFFDHSDQVANTPETPPVGNINIHIEAESFASQSGTYSADGIVGGCDNSDWLQYNSINMTGVTELKIQCTAPQSLGRVEVRLGTTTGQLLGYLQGPNTGSWDTYSGYVIPLAATTGVQNIVFLFKDASGIMNMDWMEFTGPGPNGLPVRGISLQNTSLTLSAGQTGQLIKTITPAEATNQNVTWVSSHPVIATVNNSGIVTAVANGTAMITVTTTSGNQSAKAVIHVKPTDNNIVSNSEFDSGTTGWELGDWTGPGFSKGENTFSSVTGAGLSGTKALFVDVVNNNNGYWTLQPYSVLNFKLELGKTYEVSFMAKAQSGRPIGVALRGEQTNTDIWNTNENLTTTAQTFTYQVTCADNIVTANSSFTIAFFLASEVISDVWIDKVIVKEITPGGTPATNVSVSPTTLTLAVGQHGQITPTVLPANALNQVTWTSSNSNVAVVNKDGLVSALAAGTATITAKTITGNYTASTSLTITAAATNTLLNSEFDSGTSGWELGDWTGPGYSKGQNTFTTVTGAGLSGTNALKVDVINANSQSWTLQVYNRLNFKLEYGRTYEISFMAKGQTVRNLGAALRGEQTNTDFWNTSAPLSTSANTFGPYQFTCYDNNVNLNTTFTMAFFLADVEISDVWIDKVIVRDVTVGSVTASSLTVSPSRLSLSTGQTSQLTRTLSPATSTDPNVTWTSDNTDVATVNTNGLVTAVSTGTATITATSSDGGFTVKATVSVNPGVTSYSTRLTGMPNDKYGLVKSLSVMPGDVIEMEVWAKYLDNDINSWSEVLTTLMTQIAQGTAPTGTFIDGGAAGSIGGATFPYIGTLPRTDDTGDGPKAYLNYIVFDKNMSSVPLDFGFARMTTTTGEHGQDGPHERLAFDGEHKIVIKEAGYMYIYLSNENDTPVEVYFDDFKVTHIKGPIVSSQDYYPFGLTFNSNQKENSVDQKFKFQGQEHIDDLNLGWDSFKWRNHQPDIGRFFNIDPLAEKYFYNSPYAFSENKVIAHVELEGLEAETIVRKEVDRVGSNLKSLWHDLKTTVSDGIDAITPRKQIGKTDLERKNPPEKVPEEQHDGGVRKTEAPSDLDGMQAAQYNPDGTAVGQKGGDEVVTQEGAQTKIEKPDKPSPLIKIDTVWDANTRTVDNATKDSTSTFRDFKTSDGGKGSKLEEKKKGSTPWIKPSWSH